MALPTSGTISVDDIKDEFGGGNPFDLNEYYRGGTKVPNTTINAGIPTIGTLNISDFYGAANSSPAPTLYAHSVYFTSSPTAICSANNRATVYQTTSYLDYNLPLYSNSAGTSFAAPNTYGQDDFVYGGRNYRYWNGSSWSGSQSFWSRCEDGSGGNI